MNAAFRFHSRNSAPAFCIISPQSKEERIMRTFAKIAGLVGVVGVVGLSGVLPASADWYGRHHRYYDYYGGGGTWNGCPPGYTVQGGNCAPYQGPRGPFAPRGSRFWWQ
jgi:hypothetical protein